MEMVGVIPVRSEVTEVVKTPVRVLCVQNNGIAHYVSLLRQNNE